MKLADHIDAREWLRGMRTGNGLTQGQMAELMGIPRRTYEDLEYGKTTVRPIHVNAACMALIEYAADNGGWQKLPEDLLQIARRATA